MLAPIRVVFARLSARPCRLYSTLPDTSLRARLMSEVQMAMKARDSIASTTLRSVLSEIYAADKVLGNKVPSSTIANILRKAVSRRNDAAAKFTQASRQDLADKELREQEILLKFSPPLLSEAEIDRTLRHIINTLPADLQTQKALGRVFRDFYQKVDKSEVDINLVKRRAEFLVIHEKEV